MIVHPRHRSQIIMERNSGIAIWTTSLSDYNSEIQGIKVQNVLKNFMVIGQNNFGNAKMRGSPLKRSFQNSKFLTTSLDG